MMRYNTIYDFVLLDKIDSDFLILVFKLFVLTWVHRLDGKIIDNEEGYFLAFIRINFWVLKLVAGVEISDNLHEIPDFV